MELLPDVLIQKIINYTNVISYRNGVYINRIKPTDHRYEILKKITKPVYIGERVLLKLMNSDLSGYFIEYSLENGRRKMNLRFFYKIYDGNESYYHYKYNEAYIFDKHWIFIFEKIMYYRFM